ncbi:MAG TPA: hypothetical protein P5137_17265, partial [Candidatus Brocadiia bacterium]|nr:hypothetical protein [Candidatus Brocadiia bacterium]
MKTLTAPTRCAGLAVAFSTLLALAAPPVVLPIPRHFEPAPAKLALNAAGVSVTTDGAAMSVIGADLLKKRLASLAGDVKTPNPPEGVSVAVEVVTGDRPEKLQSL